MVTRQTDGERLAELGTDGEKWARGLAEALELHGYDDGTTTIDATPGGLLHVWVTNAIEAGRSAGAQAGYAQGAELIGEHQDEILRLRTRVEQLEAGADPLQRMAAALETLAGAVAPQSSYWAAPSLRVEAVTDVKQ